MQLQNNQCTVVIKLAEQSSAHDIKYCPLAATSQPPEMTDSERTVLTLLGSYTRYMYVYWKGNVEVKRQTVKGRCWPCWGPTWGTCMYIERGTWKWNDRQWKEAADLVGVLHDEVLALLQFHAGVNNAAQDAPGVVHVQVDLGCKLRGLELLGPQDHMLGRVFDMLARHVAVTTCM